MKSSRDENGGAYRSGEGGGRGEKSLLSKPGSELRLGREKETETAPG